MLYLVADVGGHTGRVTAQGSDARPFDVWKESVCFHETSVSCTMILLSVHKVEVHLHT